MLHACSFSMPMISPRARRRSASSPQRRCNAIEARAGIDRAPVRKHAHDSRAGALGNLERAAREPRLIVECERRAEHVLLDVRRNRRGVRQRALQYWRRDRQDPHAARLDLCTHAVYLGVAMVEDVLAVDDPQLGEGHAEIGHRPERAVEAVGRELVRDRAD